MSPLLVGEERRVGSLIHTESHIITERVNAPSSLPWAAYGDIHVYSVRQLLQLSDFIIEIRDVLERIEFAVPWFHKGKLTVRPTPDRGGVEITLIGSWEESVIDDE